MHFAVVGERPLTPLFVVKSIKKPTNLVLRLLFGYRKGW
jgi:hypothetical protein